MSTATRTFALTDAGNAERLRDAHGRDFRRVARWGKFIVWDGQRWQVDECGRMTQMALDAIREAKRRANAIDDEDRRVALQAHARKSESARALRDMVALAGDLADMTVSPDRLDADPWLVNARNGAIDLRTGDVRDAAREDLCTKIIPVNYRPGAPAPMWREFLDTTFAGDAELIRFVQKAVGYSLTGRVTERCLFVLHGGGANGKSTLLSIVSAVLGDYATTSSAELLLQSGREGGIRNDVARLKGARFVAASESNAGRRLDEGLIKSMTGGEDKLTARFLYQEEFQFLPEFKIWLATNHKPDVRGTDDGIWDRIRLVPFNVRIPEERRDRDLSAKLREELPGVLAWAVEGCLLWRREGLGAPAAVREATRGYREEMDVLAEFVGAECVTMPTAVATAADLYARYSIWSKVNGMEAVTQTRFGRQLRERGFAQDREGSGRTIWRGIGLKKHDP